ncbi:MAG: hypothetical protein ACR2P1_22760 [Pseudomonadales bacterium]
MINRWTGLLGRAMFVGLIAILIAFTWLTRNVDGPIPSELPADYDRTVVPFVGQAHVPQSIAGAELPVHPFLAPQGQNSMHNDSYQSDSYTWMGPLGKNTQVDSARFHPMVGNCVAAAMDPKGRLISTCVTPFGVTLVARDPDSLAILARKKITHWLPIGQKFGGGVYFHLDHKGRVLLASNEPAIELWALEGEGGKLRWKKEQSIALAAALDSVQEADHRVIDVMPDWQGNYWFITRSGQVGVSDRDGKHVAVISLPGEGIDNALAAGEHGVFVVSDHAMYRFERGADSKPAIMWRETYDRGAAPKPGTMGHGSGTTPTLVGNDFVAFTDNADGRFNVVVHRQLPAAGESPFICKVPIFKSDLGTSENSLSAIGNSLIVENNFGYQGPFENISAEPGLARIDIDSDNSSCKLAWENLNISSPSAVPKVSLANGLIYVYTRDDSNPEDMPAWYFTAVDAHTGELVYKVLTGVGKGFNNHYGSISITPDGTAYVGTINGVVKVWDSR